MTNIKSTVNKNSPLKLAEGEFHEVKHWFMPEAKKYIEMHYIYKGDVIKKIGTKLEHLLD